MTMKEIRIPKALRELHGERSTLACLAIVYATGLGVAGAIVLGALPFGLAPWRLLVLALVALDIGGGVAANLSSSTNRYYAERPRLRRAFILLHVLQPAILAAVLPEAWPYFASAGAFTLLSCLMLGRIKDRELQQGLAALLVALGLAASLLLFDLRIQVLHAFAPLYMMKLILGFSVQRPDFRQAGN
jgi:hypothetical protein